ncbi:MAG: cytochrome P450 [Pseudomonadota bacterium]
MDARAPIPAPDALYTPHPAPPPLSVLRASKLRRTLHIFRSILRTGKNFLNLYHPEIETNRWLVNYLRGEQVVSINDAGLARHVLQTNSDNYVKGRFYEIIFGEFLGKSSLTLEKDAWKQRRRLISPAFNARAMKGVEGVVTRHVEALVAKWDAAAETGDEVDLTADAGELTMRIAMEAFFSADMGADPARIGRLMEDIITFSGSIDMADVLQLPWWVPRRSKTEVRAWMAELDAWLYALIDQRLADRAAGEPDSPDLLDILVHARDEETGELLDRQAIRNEVLTLFAAGHETTALSLSWGLDRLAREPEWQARLAQAARAAQEAAGHPLTVAEAKGETLLAAAYDEILRLYPPAFSVGRTALEADRFEDLEIEPGARIQLAIHMIHRNPRYWTDPGKFDPARFLAEGRANRPPFAHMPFGGGPRICVGLALAKMEGLMALARILPRFELEAPGAPPKPLGKITLRTEGPVRLRVRRRT